MKFKINGVNDEKILISLKKLTNSFIKENEFVNFNALYNVFIDFEVRDKEIKVILKCDDFYVEEKQVIVNNIEYDKKYLILSCFYKFLVEKTKKELSYGVLSGIRPTKLVHKYIKEKYKYEDILNILKNKYLIKDEKAKLLLNIAYTQRKIIRDFDLLYKEVSIYINIPFCLSRCSYCSFTSYSLDYKFVSTKDYLEKLFIEIKTIGSYLKNKNIKITSIYVGGGTPTSLSDKELNELLICIENNLIFDNIKEYTFECGRPDSLTTSKLLLLFKSSVSRISINPQTFNDNTLLNVKRNHTVNDIIEKFNEARRIGFDNINMDLIIGLPNENLDDYKNSISKTIELNPESITIHYLARKRGSDLFVENIEDNKEDIFEAFDYSFNTINKNGYIPYYLYRQKNISGNLENIGYSKICKESIYNIVMIEELQNIIGLGCNSSSKFINHKLIINPKDLISYVNSYDDYLNKKLETLNENLF